MHCEVNHFDAIHVCLCECGINDDNDVVEDQIKVMTISMVLFTGLVFV